MKTFALFLLSLCVSASALVKPRYVGKIDTGLMRSGYREFLTPAGKRKILASTRDLELTLWDVETQTEEARLPLDAAPGTTSISIAEVFATSQGEVFALVYGNAGGSIGTSVTVVNVLSGASRWLASVGSVPTAAFLEDSKQKVHLVIAHGRWDPAGKGRYLQQQIDLDTMQVVAEIAADEWSRPVLYSRNGELLALILGDSRVQLWSLTQNRVTTLLQNLLPNGGTNFIKGKKGEALLVAPISATLQRCYRVDDLLAGNIVAVYEFPFSTQVVNLGDEAYTLTMNSEKSETGEMQSRVQFRELGSASPPSEWVVPGYVISGSVVPFEKTSTLVRIYGYYYDTAGNFEYRIFYIDPTSGLTVFAESRVSSLGLPDETLLRGTDLVSLLTSAPNLVQIYEVKNHGLLWEKNDAKTFSRFLNFSDGRSGVLVGDTKTYEICAYDGADSFAKSCLPSGTVSADDFSFTYWTPPPEAVQGKPFLIPFTERATPSNISVVGFHVVVLE